LSSFSHMADRCRIVLIISALVLVTACTQAPQGIEIYDPYETANRKTHVFNRGVDKVLLRPASQGYGKAVPNGVQNTVVRFASNVDQPRIIVNDILQGQFVDAFHNTFRFLINSTFGMAGLTDPATEMGLEQRPSDFGETLHVWGSGEGAFVELPLLGPSTTRDTVGRVVDIILNPTRFAYSDEFRAASTVSGSATLVGNRYQFSDFVDEILYESADSYAQSRQLYLQNRRFELGGPANEEDYFDPFEDPAFQ
jgi:phospholipid-binding lipoprotein MlaA